MPRRFFFPDLLKPGPCRLVGPQAHHLIHVLRLRAGEAVTLFDGRGFEAAAQIMAIEGTDAQLLIDSVHEAYSEPQTQVTLAVAVPKGERFDWLVEKATELGVGRLVPLITERSIVVPGFAKLERLRRRIIEASKQCGRSRLMELASPAKWADFVESELAVHPAWVAHPEGEPAACILAALNGSAQGPNSHEFGYAAQRPNSDKFSYVGAIGPEGGFSESELELALRAGAKLVSLGPRVLRIETAALVLAALLSGVTGDR